MKPTIVLFNIVLIGSCFSQEPSYKIALFDTGFCPTQIKTKHTIHATQLVNDFCVTGPRKSLHGQYVLQEFLSRYSGKIPLEIHFFQVFDEKGEQSEKLWQKALVKAKDLKLDLSLMAVGFPFETQPKWKLPSYSVVASGQVGRGIKKKTKLWPQVLKDKNLKIVTGVRKIGEKSYGFFPGTMNLNDLDFVIELPKQNPKQKIFYSSLAVSIASAKLLNLCGDRLMNCLPTKTTLINGKSWQILK